MAENPNPVTRFLGFKYIRTGNIRALRFWNRWLFTSCGPLRKFYFFKK